MLKGFFFKSEQVRDSIVKGDPCEVCGLYRGCKSPRMPYSGQGRLGVLIVAEAPGKEEDDQNTQLVGEVGQAFRGWLKEFGLDLDRDFYKTNAVACRPPGNRTPTRREVKCCRFQVERVIRELRPRFIWVMGGVATESFFMDHWTDNLSISRWRGRCIPDRRYKAWLIPMFHPSFVVRKGDERARAFFLRDLQWALGCLEREPPVFFDPEEYVQILYRTEEVAGWIDKALVRKEPIVIDYETSCISPYKKDGEILTVALSQGGETIAFPLDWPGVWGRSDLEVVEAKLRELFVSPLGKVAHNIKFEEGWTRRRFGSGVENWLWDTMLAEHVLDCRQEVTGLKFQAYVRWGVSSYDSDVKPYLSREDEFEYNRLREADWRKVCLYCGCDAFLEHKLWLEQVSQMRGRLSRAYRLLHDGVLAFVDAEQEGICVDEKYFVREHERLSKMIEETEANLLGGDEAAAFREATGKQINLQSPSDLRCLFFEILGIKPLKVTAKGNNSVDRDILERLDVPFAKKLVSLRKLLKIRDTYIAQIVREVVNGKIHPSFNLHIARSYRSSCDRPNFQNIPVRDEESKRSIRTGIVPSSGWRLMDVDYSSLEVRIAACLSRDPELEKYIYDPATDLHRDQAMELFLLRKRQVNETLRFYAKNMYVFAEIYGSYWGSIVQSLWPLTLELNVGELTLRDHLRRKGIRSSSDFEEHVRSVESRFWERFAVLREWQMSMMDKYMKKGYVEMPTGFRRGEFLDRNQVFNSPIQGAAFHCLLWSFIELNRIRRKEGWRTKLIGQIHDSIIFDLCPEEQDYVLSITNWVMTERIREAFGWVSVPLKIEAKVSEIDGNWCDMRSVDVGGVND